MVLKSLVKAGNLFLTRTVAEETGSPLVAMGKFSGKAPELDLGVPGISIIVFPS